MARWTPALPQVESSHSGVRIPSQERVTVYIEFMTISSKISCVAVVFGAPFCLRMELLVSTVFLTVTEMISTYDVHPTGIAPVIPYLPYANWSVVSCRIHLMTFVTIFHDTRCSIGRGRRKR
jgi:hypothetical protein